MNPIAVLSMIVAGALPAGARSKPVPPAFAPAAAGSATPDCELARGRLERLLADTDVTISAGTKALAEAQIEKASKSGSPASVWDDLAGIAYLRGNVKAALWCELHAIQAEWRSDFVEHTGVYLAATRRFDDAKTFLHCAYGEGERSEYLFEALALAYRGLGDRKEATSQILRAEELAPEDRLITGEVQAIETGAAPKRPTSRPDPLHQALDEVQRRLDRLRAREQDVVAARARLDAIFGMKRADNVRQTYESRAATTQKEIDRLRSVELPNAEKTLADFRKTNPSASRELYDMNHTNIVNGFVSRCISIYIGICQEDLLTFSPFDEGFWNLSLFSDALGRNLFAYASSAATDRREGMPGFVSSSGLWPDDDAALEYTKVKRDADGKFADDTRPCHDDECRRQARAAWCVVVLPAFAAWQNSAQQSFQTASHGFNPAADKMLAWSASIAGDGRDYAMRTMKLFRRRTPAALRGLDPMYAKTTQQLDEMLLKEINQRYAQLVTEAEGKQGQSGAVVGAYVANNLKNLIDARNYRERELDREDDLLERSCSPVAKEILDLVDGSESEATRDELYQRLSESLDANWKWDPNCVFSLGGAVTCNITLYPKEGNYEHSVEWEFASSPESEPEGAGHEGGGAGEEGEVGTEWSAGVGVKTGHDAEGNLTEGSVSVAGSASAEGVVGTGEVELIEEWSPSEQNWDTVAQVKGAIGVGGKLPGVGGFACYPGEFDMRMEPREVIENAVDYLKSFDKE